MFEWTVIKGPIRNTSVSDPCSSAVCSSAMPNHSFLKGQIGTETAYATSSYSHGWSSNLSISGCDRTWLWSWNLGDIRNTKRDQVERSVHLVTRLHVSILPDNAEEELSSGNGTMLSIVSMWTTRWVVLEMFCALLPKSVSIVFCYPAGFEVEKHSVTGFQHRKVLTLCNGNIWSNLAQDAKRLIGPLRPSGLLQNEVNPRWFQPWWAWYHRPCSSVCPSSCSLSCVNGACVENHVFQHIFSDCIWLWH